MKILHILRKRNDAEALEIAARQRDQGHEVSILLAHDGVLSDRLGDFTAFACKDDVLARGIQPAAQVLDYDAIIRLIFENDSSVTW